MKKLAILVICLLACLTLFTGCTDPKGGDGQDSNVNSGVEVDITDPSSTDEPAGSDTLGRTIPMNRPAPGLRPTTLPTDPKTRRTTAASSSRQKSNRGTAAKELGGGLSTTAGFLAYQAASG